MSILKMTGQWSATWHKAMAIPKGYLLVRYDPKYRKNVAAALTKLDEWQKKKMGADLSEDAFEQSLRPIDITFDIHYKKRSLDANALMWSLYEIEANEMNGHRKSADMETAMHIYEQDMKTFAPQIEVRVTPDKLDLLKRTYSMVKTVLRGAWTYATVYVTSSFWNGKEMHDHLEMIFDRLSMAGVDLKSTADISHYWMEWQQALSDQKIVLHDGLYTVDEYRELVKNCEACGRAVWHEDIGSSVAHIKAVGMGGHRERRYAGTELMHLCDVDHAAFDNGKGRDVFLKDWPHLKYKVETSLKRAFEPQAETLEDA